MEFTFKERMQSIALLPITGGYADLKLSESARGKLDSPEAETKEHGIRFERGGISYDSLPAAREVDLTEEELGLIRKSLLDLDKTMRLTADLVPLYEKLCL